MYFKNLSGSPMSTTPRWQDEIVNEISVDFEQAAIDCSEEFRAAAAAALDAEPGFAGVAIDRAMRNVGRFVWRKGIEFGGCKYEAQIDLLLHTVLFIEV